MAFVALFQFCQNKGAAHAGFEQIRPQLAIQFFAKVNVAHDKTVFQHGSADGVILCPKFDAVTDGA